MVFSVDFKNPSVHDYSENPVRVETFECKYNTKP